VLCELFEMNREDDGLLHPNRFIHLFRQFAENVPILFHDLPCDSHLRFELRIIGRQPDTAWHFGDMYGVPRTGAKARERFFWKNDAHGVTDPAEFQSGHYEPR
jgi:hypothetical protein